MLKVSTVPGIAQPGVLCSIPLAAIGLLQLQLESVSGGGGDDSVRERQALRVQDEVGDGDIGSVGGADRRAAGADVVGEDRRRLRAGGGADGDASGVAQVDGARGLRSIVIQPAAEIGVQKSRAINRRLLVRLRRYSRTGRGTWEDTPRGLLP